METLSVISQRLKNWELRERKKTRDHSKGVEREDERLREMVTTPPPHRLAPPPSPVPSREHRIF